MLTIFTFSLSAFSALSERRDTIGIIEWGFNEKGAQLHPLQENLLNIDKLRFLHDAFNPVRVSEDMPVDSQYRNHGSMMSRIVVEGFELFDGFLYKPILINITDYLNDSIDLMIKNSVKIFSISSGFKITDEFGLANRSAQIANNNPEVLFIIASGNDAKNLYSMHNQWPHFMAKFHLENVKFVGGVRTNSFRPRRIPEFIEYEGTKVNPYKIGGGFSKGGISIYCGDCGSTSEAAASYASLVALVQHLLLKLKKEVSLSDILSVIDQFTEVRYGVDPEGKMYQIVVFFPSTTFKDIFDFYHPKTLGSKTK